MAIIATIGKNRKYGQNFNVKKRAYKTKRHGMTDEGIGLIYMPMDAVTMLRLKLKIRQSIYKYIYIYSRSV